MSNSTVSGCTMTAVAFVTSDVMVLVKFDVDEINGMLTNAGGCVFDGVDTMMYAWIAALAAYATAPVRKIWLSHRCRSVTNVRKRRQ